MPATVTGSPLGIACVFSDGSAATFSLDGLPCPVLVRDLLDGLANLVHPHGTVDTAGSVTHYVQSVRDMTRKLAARGSPAGRRTCAVRWRPSTGLPPPARGKRAPAGCCRRSPAGSTRRWPSWQPDAPITPSAITGRFLPIRRKTGTGWRARAARSRTGPSPLTGRRWRRPPAGSARPAAGRRRTCAGCWPGPGRSRPRSSANCWAAPAARSSSGADSPMPSRTCSRPRMS